MPYTNAWTNNVPLGSTPANQIDDYMRRVRLDIQERMDDIVVDWTADPVVPLAADGVPAFRASYNDLASAGSKAANYGNIAALLTIRYHGTAVNKNVTINLNEVNTAAGGGTNWQANNLYIPTVPGTIILPVSFVGRLSGDEALALRRMVIDTVANTVQLIIDSVDGMSNFPQLVDIVVQLPFTVPPV